MKFRLKKIDHLTRYFLIGAILIFVGYVNRWNDTTFLLFTGPILYLALGLKKFINSLVVNFPSSERINFYLFLLPLTILYFGLIGFQIKKLFNERGFIRFVSLFAFLLFLTYIHYTAWKTLQGYFTPPPPPPAL